MQFVMDEETSSEVTKPTNELSKCIKAIDQSTVQKICSGQVIISLAVAVKELVENSLDAGATIIEVKLKEYGLESIEVSDNGCGVNENDFEGLTSRYNTSKLRDFSDLESVETFGFRGEALNSLCALSNMIIITRHRSVEIATKLEFDHQGVIKKQMPYPRQIGTTVIMSNIFSTFPVRKKDFAKNIKKEFTKMCQILQAYCLVSKGVRILCTNQTSKSGRNTFMSTNGSVDIIDNIQAIFGTKQVSDIIEIKSPLNDVNDKFTVNNLLESSLDEMNNDRSYIVTHDDVDKLNQIKLKMDSWISSCTHGCGRSSRDRQYFFINSRPCEPKNIIKLVNEIYHRYNTHQYPFVYLNISMERNEIDVNLTPDKRMLLIHNEKLLLLILKQSLLRTFNDNIPTTFKIENTKLDLIFKRHDELEKQCSATEIDSDDEIKLKPENSMKFAKNLLQWKATGSTDGPYQPVKCIKRKKSDDEITQFNVKVKKIQSVLSQATSNTSIENVNYETSESSSDSSDSEEDANKAKSLARKPLSSNLNQLEAQSKEFDALTQPSCLFSIFEQKNKSNEDFQLQNNTFERRINCRVEQTESKSPKLIIESKKNRNFPDDESPRSKNTENDSDDEVIDVEKMTPTQLTTILDSDNDDDESIIDLENYEEIDIAIDEIKSLVMEEEESQERLAEKKIHNKFLTEIAPDKNKRAEEELNREINKEMFKKMEIIGQFNLGFIIVKLYENLFIIDQHASDEKYNFEILQKTTNLQYQPLTIPQNLELTAVNEMVLIDHLKVFEANGFRFQIDENAPVTKKLKLVGKPFSRNWEFGKSDIEELIFMLQDAPEGVMCRPSRICSMFASRACRKSIMIGKPLNQRIMRQLVNHMGEIEHPWNCPHGRPTMRHLVNLDMLSEE